MKKTVFALFAVLLALSLATCDLLDLPDGETLPLVTADGRPMVRLTINVNDGGTNRSLTTGLAHDDVVYYEVAFKDPQSTTMYRLAWGKDDGLQTISVPLGTYDTTDKAVLFAGIGGTDKILLAVGKLTATNAGSGTVIGPSTTSVTFTLAALQNDIANSSFNILGPTAAQTAYPTALHNSYTNIALGMKEVDLGAASPYKRYPVFSIPEAGYTDAGDSNYDDTASNIIAEYTINCGAGGLQNSYYAGVALKANWGVTPTPFQITSPAMGPTAYPPTTITTTAKPLATGVGNAITASPYTAPATFRFLIGGVATAANGISKVSIDAQVVPINTTAGTGAGSSLPATWHIYGGEEKDDPDGGAQQNTAPTTAAADSTGGAVLLAVGGVELIAAALQPIQINPPTSNPVP